MMYANVLKRRTRRRMRRTEPRDERLFSILMEAHEVETRGVIPIFD
jgi:hypothetical protein